MSELDKVIKPKTYIERTISKYPLSIGTSIGLESLFDSSPISDNVSQTKINILEFTNVYINVSLLFRNMVDAADKEALYTTKPIHIFDLINAEIDSIKSLFYNEGGNVIVPVFYMMKYKNIENLRNLRIPNTQYQKVYKATLNELCLLFKNNDEVITWENKIMPSRGKVMIMTHIVHDLLNYINFDSLHLLESYTGVLKDRYMWYTKFVKVPDVTLNNIPFNKTTLFIFGDKYMFKALPIKAKKSILSIASSKKWTSMSTEDKIKLDINLFLKDLLLKKVILSIR